MGDKKTEASLTPSMERALQDFGRIYPILKRMADWFEQKEREDARAAAEAKAAQPPKPEKLYRYKCLVTCWYGGIMYQPGAIRMM